jgi:hypothetical protein
LRPCKKPPERCCRRLFRYILPARSARGEAEANCNFMVPQRGRKANEAPHAANRSGIAYSPTTTTRSNRDFELSLAADSRED